MPFLRRYLPAFIVAFAIVCLYGYQLDGVGVLEPDEPRYAAIGLQMARSRHFITPILWGSPWFEKPPLLYWMTAAGSAAGLNMDLAGRVPVVLLSLSFLALSFLLLKREFGVSAAAVAVSMLATSAGWLAFSELCLTDIPLAVFFSLAVFLSLPLLRKDSREQGGWRFLAIGFCLGLGTLAKGLVPVALALPFFWFLRLYWKQWWLAMAAFLVTALPWYLAVYAQNGFAFVQEFFIRHHLERLYSAALQHVQPWYYYLPVLVAGIFPWTPALVLLRGQDWDQRRKFLLTIVCFGFVFFSLSRNKLAGYLLPILPSLFAVLGAYFQRELLSRTNRVLLVACGMCVAVLPLLAVILPASLAAGRFSLASASIAVNRTTMFYVLVPVVITLIARRSWVAPLLVLAVAAGGLYVKAMAYPVLDEQVSARGLWREVRVHADQLCDGGANRDWIYGLTFYRGSALPVCDGARYPYRIQSHGHARATVTYTP